MSEDLAVIEYGHGSALAAARDTGMVPVMGIAAMKATMGAVQECMREVMVAGQDYGVIPGTQKPTLLKAGAEKLGVLFGLRSTFIIDAATEDREANFYSYTVRCVLTRLDANGNEQQMSSTIASANSRESRYAREQAVPEWKMTSEQRDQVERWETKSNDRGTYRVGIIPSNAADLANTLLKMAGKRAYVDAMLKATMASALFTQDLEDMPGVQLGGNAPAGAGSGRKTSGAPSPRSSAPPVQDGPPAAAPRSTGRASAPPPRQDDGGASKPGPANQVWDAACTEAGLPADPDYRASVLEAIIAPGLPQRPSLDGRTRLPMPWVVTGQAGLPGYLKELETQGLKPGEEVGLEV